MRGVCAAPTTPGWLSVSCVFFNDTATTEIYTLSLHDALPILSQWEVGVGLVAGGGPMARLPRVMGRGRALEVLLSADDIRGADAELLGYVNRALPDAELDNFVDALATRIASFDKWAIAHTKRLVNEASLPPDVETRAGWDACMASVKRPAAQARVKALLEA